MYQTRPPDETIVLLSGASQHDLEDLREDFPHAEFFPRENRNDFGHEKRAEGLALASKDWVGFFNDDDSYAMDYVEKMLRAAYGYDVAFCAWNSHPHCLFAIGSSTSGNFVVWTSLAKLVGYTSRRYEADGDFIEALKSAGAQVAPKVQEILYHHNFQP